MLNYIVVSGFGISLYFLDFVMEWLDLATFYVKYVDNLALNS